jgi:hypothetical protein
MRHGQYGQRNEKCFLKMYLEGALITALVVLKGDVVIGNVMERGPQVEMEMLFMPMRAQDWDMSRESGRQR